MKVSGEHEEATQKSQVQKYHGNEQGNLTAAKMSGKMRVIQGIRYCGITKA